MPTGRPPAPLDRPPAPRIEETGRRAPRARPRPSPGRTTDDTPTRPPLMPPCDSALAGRIWAGRDQRVARLSVQAIEWKEGGEAALRGLPTRGSLARIASPGWNDVGVAYSAVQTSG